MIGAALGHYEIVAQLGSGGMGTVYLAEDHQLRRRVAIKVLSADLAKNPLHVARFEREARALAALSHPHVVTVHSVAEVDGTHFFTMELIDGRTLAELIPEGGMGLPELFAVAVPLAGAVAAAHAVGITHRDLKPANVMLTRDGRVKVLDFGLARHRGAFEGDPDRSSDLTEEGHLVGTLPYMSPEQLQGQPLDHRSDVFSLGALLYEMATGERAFRGNPAQIISAILRDSPMPVSEVRQALPHRLGRIVRRCLEKDPEQRYQSAAELRDELQDVSRERAGDSAVTSTLLRPVAPPWWRDLRWAAVAAAAVLAAAALWMVPRLRPRAAGEPLPAAAMAPLVTWPSNESKSRFSPDGQWATFVSDRTGRRSLWMTRLSGGEPRLLAAPPGNVISHVWSPDGLAVAFLVLRDEGVFLQTVPAFGGPPDRTFDLASELGNATLLRWVGDSVFLRLPSRQLYRFDLAGGELTPLLQLAGGLEPALSRDGTRLAFRSLRDGGLWTSDVKGNNRVRQAAVIGLRSPLWLGPDDRFLVYAAGEGGQTDLWRLALDGGGRQRITLSSESEEPDDAAANGSLVSFTIARGGAQLWRLDPKSGHAHQLTAGSLEHLWPSVTADGKQVAFQRSRPLRDKAPPLLAADLVVAEARSEAIDEGTAAAARGGLPRISPDGRRLAYFATSGDLADLWVQELDTGRARKIAERCRLAGLYEFPREWDRQQLAWAADGRSLLFIVTAASGEEELHRLRLDSPQPEVLARAGGREAILGDLRLAPDGSAVAYLRLPTGGGGAELHWHRLADGRDRVLLRQQPTDDELYVAGWLQGGDLLVLAGSYNPDWSERVELRRVTPLGIARPIATVDGAYAGTARLDASGNTLYLTKVDERATAHNLYALHLPEGRLERLTDVTVPGVSFGAVAMLADGSLLYSRLERNSDVFVVRFAQ